MQDPRLAMAPDAYVDQPSIYDKPYDESQMGFQNRAARRQAARSKPRKK